MRLSKSTRITILLGINSIFFLLELVVGYMVHSLALVADSFHMLNDVISLFVGLWAVKVASEKTKSTRYTYGWQRAETLGALINGVFLVALCLSIFLEAIQRIVEPQEVSQPQLVLIVGSLGLASNLVGLVLFHDVGHSHGPASCSHSHGDEHIHAEEGYSHGMQAHDHENDNRHAEGNSVQPPQACRKSTSNMHGHHNVRSGSHGYSTLDELLVHPSSFRSSIIEFSRQEVNDANLNESGYDHSTEQTSLLSKDNGRSHPHSDTPKKNHHKSHKHVKANGQTANDAHGHSHGDLNMRGVFLHILGDALGNVGVIATALFIWLTDFRWRYYADPIVSLVITVIILVSAIPLCKAASRILLQAVPDNLSIDKIKDDIAGLENIVSCHHLHVWQLSDTKLVASLHVQVDFDFKDEGSARYMSLARQIRKCLHEYGIHSSTIQPEFCLDVTHDHSAVGSEDEATKVKVPGDKDESDACLLECPDSCGTARQCCESGQKGCKGSNSP